MNSPSITVKSILKSLALTVALLITACFSFLPANQSIVRRFKPEIVEVMFWQNERYLWIGNSGNIHQNIQPGMARLDIDTGKLEIFPEIKCNEALVISEPVEIWCKNNKFDGTTWHQANVEIETPIQAQDGTLWAGGPQGLVKLDDQSTTWISVVPETRKISQSSQIFNRGQPGINLAFEAHDGALWFHGYFSHAGINRWTNISHQNWLMAGEDFMMIPYKETHNNTIWAIADWPDRDLARWDGQEWIIENPFSTLSHRPEMIAATDGSVWVATGSSEVGQWNGQSWQTWIPISSNSFITSIFQTQDAALWIISSQDEIGRWDGQSWQIWTVNDINSQGDLAKTQDCTLDNLSPKSSSTSSQDTRYINPRTYLEDNNNNIWIVLDSGIGRWAGKCWRYYSTSDGLSSTQVSLLTVSPDGTVWAGTKDAGVNFYDVDFDQWRSITFR